MPECRPFSTDTKGVKPMRRIIMQWLCPTVVASLLTFTLVSCGEVTKNLDTGLVRTVHAAQGTCSLATVQGSYVVFGQGTITGPLPGFPPPPFPTNHTGIVSFDGAGNFTGSEMASVDGMAGPATFTGTYNVNPNCTVTAELTNSLGLTTHEWGAISGSGALQEVHLIVTDAGWVFDETLKKQ
jgi:hypothetical protein